VLYRDEFQTNLGWQLGQSAVGGASLIEGRLRVAVRQPNAFFSVRSPAPDLENFYAQVSVRSEVCSEGDEFGLMFRFTRYGDHYRFTLTCSGEARVSRSLESGEIALIPITPTHTIIPGRLVENHLAVRASEASFRFYINGTEVFAAQDSSLAIGGIGFYVRSRRGGQTTASFDHLLVRGLEPTPVASSTSIP
jgi:hypothetical protein